MSIIKSLQSINMGRMKKFFYFALVGGFGTILNTAILFLLTKNTSMNYLIASGIATEIAILSNFVGNNYFTFKNQNTTEKIYKKFLSFQLISLVSLFGTMFFLWTFVTIFGKNLLLVWNVISILIMFVANFILNSMFTWKAKNDVLVDVSVVPVAVSDVPFDVSIVQPTENVKRDAVTSSSSENKSNKSSEYKTPAYKKNDTIISCILLVFFLLILAQSSFALNSKHSAQNSTQNITLSVMALSIDANQSVSNNTLNNIIDNNTNITANNINNTLSLSGNLAIDSPAFNATTNATINTTITSLNLNITANSTNNTFINGSDGNTTFNSTGNTSIIYSINASINNSINISNNITKNVSSNALITTPNILALNAILNSTNNSTINAANTTNATNQTQNISSIGAIVAVSQLGYHPLSIKEVVVYTNAVSGIFNIRDSNTNTILASLPLGQPQNYAGSNVNCQGNMPCLTGDFTNFTTEGSYYIDVNGIKSHTFVINQNIFSSTVPLFFEFFNAELQQGSSYHADMNSGYGIPFTSMSDGSFIMEADQAALPLIRLGSAYRRNPQLFQFDNYNILAPGKPDAQEYIVSYVNYLESLQGVSVQDGNRSGAVRLGYGMLINNIFVPGPTNLTSMNVYIPGSPPTFLQSVNVVSLCGVNDSSSRFQNCINYAAQFYKCQINEPCLNMTYNDRVGTITSNASKNGYAVSQGWNYDFGCYFDVNLNTGNFNNGAINPCQVFYNDTSRMYTSMTLLAFLEAYPAANDFSPSKGQELLTRSINTYNYMKNNYPAFISGDSDAGFYGASLFLLYDYTNNSAYLQEAYTMRSLVSTVFISDATHGNEFYWEEYVRHKNAINSFSLAYQLNSANPEEFFRGKMFQDYKDAGPTAISNNGERVFQFDPNVQFQNSRYMLIEGLLGQKTTELVSSPESFIPVIAQNQLSWLTGMNVVQQGTGLNAPVKSMSFIFGIGDFPTQFHSRWLINTGYSAASSGSVIGARGTDYQFFDSANNSYIYFDGVSNILGSTLGSEGNSWHNEQSTDVFKIGQTFKNGQSYIPGWISGAFPAAADGDTIFNYNNDVHAYEYTETTNEMVAAAIEYYAYLDGDLNNRSRYDGSIVNGSISGNQTNTTTNTTTNSTQSNLKILTNPGFVSISINNTALNFVTNATSDVNGILFLQNLTTGGNLLTATKTNYSNYSIQINLLSGNNSINITLVPINITTITNTTNSTTNSTTNTTTNITNVSNAKITSSSTSLTPISSNNSIQYFMREDTSATFSVISNTTNTITWFVDGIAQNTTVAQNSSFLWTPGILWIPRSPNYYNMDASTIIAQSPTENISWIVQVEDVINPFFSNVNDGGDVVGSSDSKIHVLTNNNYVSFTGVNVTILSGSGNTVYQLSKTFSNSNQSEWTIYIPALVSGNNYLTQIVGFNNITGNNITYNIGLARAHYVTPPYVAPSSSRSSNNGNNGGGGGGISFSTFNPDLVYALFGKDVVNANESQTLTLDAKNFNVGITSVDAKILTPQGTMQTLTLYLVNGTNYYGTWSTTFKSTLSGRYSLYSIEMGGNNNNSKDIMGQNQSFYSVGEGVNLINVSQNLGLVYTILSQSAVSNDTKVDLVLDARDSSGILNVSALIASTQGDNFVVPLTMIKGENIYGTWSGSFIVTEPDTTYSVKSITLNNANNTKTYDLNDRSVYVFAIPSSGQAATNGNSRNLLTGYSILGINGFGLSDGSIFTKDYWSSAIKKPLMPTILGFTIMLVVLGGIFLFRRR